MSDHKWVKEFPGAITVCDAKGIILEMNDKAAKTFEKDGGADLIGKNMLDCHPEPARSKTERLLAAREKNVYTIEKNGDQETNLPVTLVQRWSSIPVLWKSPWKYPLSCLILSGRRWSISIRSWQ